MSRLPVLSSALLLAACAVPNGNIGAQAEGEEIVSAEIPVDIEVLSAWTASDTYVVGDELDVSVILANHGPDVVRVAIRFDMISENDGNLGENEGTFYGDDVSLDVGEELELTQVLTEVLEWPTYGLPARVSVCHWDVEAFEISFDHVDHDRTNNVASTGTIAVDPR